MKRLKSRRLWVVLAILVGLLVIGRWMDRSQPIESYRVIDNRTIAVEVDASSPKWTRITGVTETWDRVVVGVGSFIFPWPHLGTDVGTSQELLVTLSQPLGSRAVVDAYTGDVVARIECPWSLASQGKCAGQPAPAEPSISVAPLPTGGISKTQAIEVAAKHSALGVTFVSAEAGHFSTLSKNPNIGPGNPIKADQWVWAVTYRGDMTICNPLGSCLSPRPGTTTVFLDYFTGDFLESEGLSPAP